MEAKIEVVIRLEPPKCMEGIINQYATLLTDVFPVAKEAVGKFLVSLKHEQERDEAIQRARAAQEQTHDIV